MLSTRSLTPITSTIATTASYQTTVLSPSLSSNNSDIITTNLASTQAALSSIQRAQSQLQQQLSQSPTFPTASQSMPATAAMQRAASQPVSSNSVGAAGALNRVLIINNTIPMPCDQRNQLSLSRRRISGQNANNALFPFAPRH